MNDLRDKIRKALAESDGFTFEGLEPHDYQKHVDAVLALLPVEPLRPSPEHAAVYLDDHDELWADYPTSPPGDHMLPLVWASEQTQSKRDLEDRGYGFRVIGWSR